MFDNHLCEILSTFILAKFKISILAEPSVPYLINFCSVPFQMHSQVTSSWRAISHKRLFTVITNSFFNPIGVLNFFKILPYLWCSFPRLFLLWLININTIFNRLLVPSLPAWDVIIFWKVKQVISGKNFHKRVKKTNYAKNWIKVDI